MSRGRYINVPQKISKHVRTQYTHSFLMVLRGITGIYGISAIPSFCILSQFRISYIVRRCIIRVKSEKTIKNKRTFTPSRIYPLSCLTRFVCKIKKQPGNVVNSHISRLSNL